MKFFEFLLLLSEYRKVIEVLHSAKIFDIEFPPDLYVRRSSQSKSVVFENRSVCICVYVCDFVGENSTLYVPKTNKNRNTKFYAQYYISIQIILPSKKKKKSGGKTLNETGNEYLKKGLNDFLQTRTPFNINTLHKLPFHMVSQYLALKITGELTTFTAPIKIR